MPPPRRRSRRWWHDYGLDQPGATLSPEKASDYAKRSHEITAAQPPATISDLADAVVYVVKRIGIDHAALATDFNHGGGIIGWKDESQAQGITEELRRRGFSDADLAKLWSGNVLRVWSAAKVGARKP
jgi:microsomal dipeptidase-like Zn-dependent dipeptidase